MRLIQALERNCGNLSLRCQVRNPRGRPPEDESTKAENRGGAARSSGEVPVMGMEAKGLRYSVL